MAPPYPFNTEIFVSADLRAPDLAELAARLRSEWSGHDQATAPADRPAAEAAIVGLYRLIGVEEPRLVWIDSPAAACPPGDDFCEPMGAAVAEAHGGPAPGGWLLPVLNGNVPDGGSGRWRSLPGRKGTTLWWRAKARRREVWEHRLTLWRDLVGSCGGWWPFERVCVVSERPIEVHVEPRHERGQATCGCTAATARQCATATAGACTHFTGGWSGRTSPRASGPGLLHPGRAPISPSGQERLRTCRSPS
ncbi:hypothetical protein [Actinomadura rudentiformis]|uniref:hypothetical protein n=1 Tax=Actinomadura rudentiformis TaxID=359158 RepID=UPI00178C4406|nr:hypothetical protein [Actinomadura rudentiformis]